MTVPAVRLEDIQPHLTKIAAGGEGVVHEVRTMPHVVFKQFKSSLPEPPDFRVLAELVEFPSKLKPADRDRLLSRTTWPTTLVTSGSSRITGYLMRALPTDLYRRYGLRANPQNVLCDWNQISYSGEILPPHMVSEIPALSTEQILIILADLVATVGILHRNGCAVGDMSGKNLVWSASPLSTMLIDCDSFRIGGRGVCVPKESPGWIDSALAGGPTTMESDIFKIGVAAFRALWRVTTGQTVTADDVRVRRGAGSGDIPPHVSELIEASIVPSGRVTIEDWIERCRMNPPRPILRPTVGARSGSVTPQPPGPRINPPPPPAPARGPRPRLSLDNGSRTSVTTDEGM
jgi:hypothetical protein